ncbi:long-chain-fatty-acid--CoA ligase FadD15 [bacterium BMS3Abin05]|nr:long-chain-fatty-acid--CoA ligase FadD15 [bacterium BMS3Abin05]GBE28362.1 long-chain-fatty-acid--CoA ligase FadD15 [bacterium BMS3Bbin03]HDZ10883.1 long-chain fatty acid--CoA ligase [Bacteroidota bacterium]
MPESDTFPKLLLEREKAYGKKKIAIREKDFGIWNRVTWEVYLNHVKNFALGLQTLGFEPEDKVSIIGDNEPEWIYAELAVQALGGIAVGIYQDSTPEEIQFAADFSDSRYIIAEDQEQIDKVLEIKVRLPHIRKVIYWDPKGMRYYQDALIMSFQDVEKRGADYARTHPGEFEERVQRGKGDDVALFLTTSGTTGRPKLVMLTYRNMIKMAENLFVKVDPLNDGMNFVSFLPLAWAGEQMMAVVAALTIGFTVNFPEEPETVRADIREIAPQMMFSPPRIWESILSDIQVRIADTTAFKRAVFNLSLKIGKRLADMKFSKQRPNLRWKLLGTAADFLAFRALRDRIGLSNIRYAYTGGAALGPDVFRFYHAIGINLKQIYGQTEISGISVVHRDGDIKFSTVGKPIPETEIKISSEGEILSKSPSVFVGYYRDPEATAEALRDGWLFSGDAGEIDKDGHLIMFDRVKDIMKLSDGSRFSPQYIENKLKFSPYVKEAVAIGNGRDYVTVFINIEMANVGKWAELHRIPYTTYVDLSQKPEVYELIREDVVRVNRELPEAARIRKFVVLHKELDADDAELTRTKKVRRGFVEERYRILIEALYSDQKFCAIEAQVKYRDGREAKIKTNLKLEFMEEPEKETVR